MALIAYLMEFKGNYGPHLIIVPNAVLVNWKVCVSDRLSYDFPQNQCLEPREYLRPQVSQLIIISLSSARTHKPLISII